MICKLAECHYPALKAHVERHVAENEREWFMPPVPLAMTLASYHPSLWQGEIERGAWQRVWGLVYGPDMFGHVSLTGMPWAPHRCVMGLGIEGEYRHQGFGRKLMRHALDFARAQESLHWVDGQALADNAAVLALDHSAGFYSVGHIADYTLRGGQSVALVQLTMRLL